MMKNRNRKLDENGEKNEWRIRKARVLSKESWLKKKENGGKEYYFRYRKKKILQTCYLQYIYVE